MEDKAITINVFAGISSKGIIHEELLVLPLGNFKFKLLRSPGLAMDMAKDDVIEVKTVEKPPIILSRGGNFCIHIYSDSTSKEEIEILEIAVNEILNGNLDGVFGGNLAFSVPSISGVENIKKVFNEFTERTGIQWYYSNIYKNPQNPNDESLLDWWL
jgi:hypothetical protein